MPTLTDKLEKLEIELRNRLLEIDVAERDEIIAELRRQNVQLQISLYELNSSLKKNDDNSGKDNGDMQDNSNTNNKALVPPYIKNQKKNRILNAQIDSDVHVMNGYARDFDFDSDPYANNKWGSMYYFERNYIAAERRFKNAIELDPKNASFHNMLGNINFKLFRADTDYGYVYSKKAISEYKKAIEIDSKYIEPHNNLGNVYIKLDGLGEQLDERLKIAISEYKKAIEIDSKLAQPHNNLGIAYSKQGNLEMAISEYKKAIEINPKYIPSHHNLVLIYSMQGNLDMVIKFCKRYIDIDTTNPFPHYNLGLAYEKQIAFYIALKEYGIAEGLDRSETYFIAITRAKIKLMFEILFKL